MAFVVLLFILFASLNRELANTDHALKVAGANKHCRALLSMNQVLTTPADTRAKIAAWVIPTMLMLPILLETMVIYSDFRTVHIGQIQSNKLVAQVFIISIVCWVLMAILTYLCIKLNLAINGLAAKMVKADHDGDAEPGDPIVAALREITVVLREGQPRIADLRGTEVLATGVEANPEAVVKFSLPTVPTVEKNAAQVKVGESSG